jgi:hypothetical protein
MQIAPDLECRHLSAMLGVLSAELDGNAAAVRLRALAGMAQASARRLMEAIEDGRPAMPALHPRPVLRSSPGHSGTNVVPFPVRGRP